MSNLIKKIFIISILNMIRESEREGERERKKEREREREKGR